MEFEKAYIGAGKEIKKIGKEVLMLGTSKGNGRNDPGSCIRLKNGAIMFLYTEYLCDDCLLDHGEARIVALFSYDEGETWQDKRVVLKKSDDQVTIGSPSLMRMKNDDIGLFYLQIIERGEYHHCIPMFIRSADEGETWGNPIKCVENDDYYVVNNDRVLRLKSGRIIVPIALHSGHTIQDYYDNFVAPGVVRFSVSDDDGYTWKLLDCEVKSPFNDAVQLQEPGIYQHEDGKLWVFSRTNYGCQYQAFSDDDGESWTPVEPNVFFSSPASPLSVKRVGEYTIGVYNPIPTYVSREMLELSGRTPLLCAVSFNDGENHGDESFEKIYYLEDDLNNGYCYPMIFEGPDYFLVAYCHSNGTPLCLNSTKITKVMYSEISERKNDDNVKGKIV